METQLFFNHLHYSNSSRQHATHMPVWLGEKYTHFILKWRLALLAFRRFGESHLNLMLCCAKVCRDYFFSPYFLISDKTSNLHKDMWKTKKAPFLSTKKIRCFFLLVVLLNAHLRKRTKPNPVSILDSSARRSQPRARYRPPSANHPIQPGTNTGDTAGNRN